MKLQGRRREDCKEGIHPPDIQRGDYWKILDQDGNPLKSDWKENLTGTCWHVAVPMGDEEGFGIANLRNHTVRENEDGTISIKPGDGSSNSILVTGARGQQWHGYIYDGVLEDC